MDIILKRIKDNAAFGTMLKIAGVVLCFVPFTSWISEMDIEDLSKLIAAGLIFLGIVFIRLGIILPGEKRTRKMYMTSNGEFDLMASRKYEPYTINKFLSLFGGFARRGRYIKTFEYTTGKLKITTKNGKFIVAPLSELRVLLVDDKFGMDGAAITLKYKDQKLKICHNDILFEDWEIEDMNRILSYAGEVKAGLATKLKFPSNFSKGGMPAIMKSNVAGLDISASDVRKKFQKPICDKDEGMESASAGEIPEDFKMGIEKYAIDTRTEEEKSADSAIYKLVDDLKSEKIQKLLVSEEDLTDWTKNSSLEGFEKMFEVYDIVVKHDRGCQKRLTLKQSAILKKLTPFYQNYKYLNRLDGEYSWLCVCFAFQICGLSIIGLSLLKSVGMWTYVIAGGCILLGIIIAMLLLYAQYSDKIEKIKKEFLNSREEVIESGKMNEVAIENVRKSVKFAERSYRLFNCCNWILGIGFIVFLLWRSYH